MSVSFEEPQFARPSASARTDAPLISLVKKMGFAKTDLEANHVLLIVLGICIIGAVLLFWLGMPDGGVSEEDYQLELQGSLHSHG